MPGTQSSPSPSENDFASLNRKFKQAQWSVDTDIDWSQPIKKAPGPLGTVQHRLISQFYHGEGVTAALCQNLLPQVSDPSVAALVSQQIEDEDRHAKAYRRYLEKFGDLSAPNPVLDILLQETKAWTGSHLGIVIAVQIILEAEFLNILSATAKTLTCPLLHQINTRVARDEARHVAFGRRYIEKNLKDLHEDERTVIYRWVNRLWLHCTDHSLTQLSIPGFVTQRLRRYASDHWQTHNATLIDLGLVTPQTVRSL